MKPSTSVTIRAKLDGSFMLDLTKKKIISYNLTKGLQGRHSFTIAHTDPYCAYQRHTYAWHVSTSQKLRFLPSPLHFWIFLNSSAFARTLGLVHRILIFSSNGVGLVLLFRTSRLQFEKDLSSCLPGYLPCWMLGLGTRRVHYASYYIALTIVSLRAAARFLSQSQAPRGLTWQEVSVKRFWKGKKRKKETYGPTKIPGDKACFFFLFFCVYNTHTEV